MTDTNSFNQAASDEVRRLLRQRKLTSRQLARVMDLALGVLSNADMGELFALKGRSATPEVRREEVSRLVGPHLLPEEEDEHARAVFDLAMSLGSD